ncbi:hypothetical protein MASR2M48_21430 [Spirochaetota bacterium]
MPTSMPCTVDAAIITQMNRRGQVKDCIIDGPLALDNAISAESARIKHIVSDVAGNADVLVAPTIEAGNLLYKALLDLGGAKDCGNSGRCRQANSRLQAGLIAVRQSWPA